MNRQFPKLKSTAGRWKRAVVDFVPSVLPPRRGRRAPYDLKWVRVDLYAYWPAGRLWVRDVTVKLVESPESGGMAPPEGRSHAGRFHGYTQTTRGAMAPAGKKGVPK